MRQSHSGGHGAQRGISLTGLIVGLVIIAVIALFGMKVIPSYMEYRAAKSAIFAIARERPDATPLDVRKAFEAHATIDGIDSIKPSDLVIEKGSISFAYQKQVPMWTGVSLLIDYTANTGQ
jgi:Tfp pilus assembly protein PilE